MSFEKRKREITARNPTDCGLGFGRNSAELPPHDERDEKYHMTSVLRPEMDPPSRRYWWARGWWGDQGRTPQCVAYAGLHYLEDGPVTHKPRRPGADPLLDPQKVYDACQQVDEWPGTDYDGTSVRALMKVFQSRGLIKNYYWAWDLHTVIETLRTTGPVVVGTWWYYDMFYPDGNGLVKVHGGRAGGHAYLLNGVNVGRRIVRFKNSWGRNWGRSGFGYMEFHDLERLIREDGEAAIAVEAHTG